jgi:xanthosine utilization system XapX-like protein
MAAMPAWQMWVYAIAVWSGLLGAVGLLLRRRWAVPVLLVSLVGAAGTFLPFAIVPKVRELATEGDAIAAIIVNALCWTSFWFARHSKQRGWLK